MDSPQYLLFAWKPGGYELLAREGEVPAVGSVLVEDGRELRVGKLGPSPLPGDDRRCAYLQPV
ncbi:MAG: hypothetical protein ACXVYM_01645 [Gaiellaceae bacterium]